MTTTPSRTIYWHETEDVNPRARLTTDIAADVCLIGGGYTSLWTSHQLLKVDPELRVVILEDKYAGAGGSGHNDGFVTPTIGHSLEMVVRRFGVEAARPVYVALGRSIMEICRFLRKHDIDAELETTGYYMVATSAAQRRRLERDIELSRQFGSQMTLRLMEGPEVRAAVPSSVIDSGIASGGALINPFKLCRGLARVVEQQGAAIYEQSRVVDVTGETARDRPKHVMTEAGSVTADTVVYATNVYQTSFRRYRRALLPVWSYAIVSEPLNDRFMEQLAWLQRTGFVEAKNFIVFGRLTADNRVLIGGGPASYFYGGSIDERHMTVNGIQAHLRAEAVRFFPLLAHVGWEYAYGGPIAVTRDFVPHVGRTGSRTFYAHGFCGNGISCAHLVGKVMRDMILERDTAYSSFFFVRTDAPKVPPEPLAYVGATVASAVLHAQDRLPLPGALRSWQRRRDVSRKSARK